MCFNRHIPATFGPSQMDREMRIVYEIDELELEYRVVHLAKDRQIEIPICFPPRCCRTRKVEHVRKSVYFCCPRKKEMSEMKKSIYVDRETGSKSAAMRC